MRGRCLGEGGLSVFESIFLSLKGDILRRIIFVDVSNICRMLCRWGGLRLSITQGHVNKNRGLSDSSLTYISAISTAIEMIYLVATSEFMPKRR